jgi:hypothetical protein
LHRRSIRFDLAIIYMTIRKVLNQEGVDH